MYDPLAAAFCITAVLACVFKNIDAKCNNYLCSFHVLMFHLLLSNTFLPLSSSHLPGQVLFWCCWIEAVHALKQVYF